MIELSILLALFLASLTSPTGQRPFIVLKGMHPVVLAICLSTKLDIRAQENRRTHNKK
jgi:hypothetical protein